MDRLNCGLIEIKLPPPDQATGVAAMSFTGYGAVFGYVNGGILTPNEGRAKLDMNPDTDPASDRLRIPANIVGDPAVAEPEPKPTGA